LNLHAVYKNIPPKTLTFSEIDFLNLTLTLTF